MIKMNTRLTKHVSNSLLLGIYWNILLDKICISYANVDGIYYFI